MKWRCRTSWHQRIARLRSLKPTSSLIARLPGDLQGTAWNDRRIAGFAARQAVQNQAFSDSFRDVQKDIDYKVNLEAERRSCADCKIVNYVNSTFAPRLVTDYTAGTTSAGFLRSTILACGQCCAGGNIYSSPAV